MSSWTPSFDPQGVQPNQVGPSFDIALGYLDPTTNTVKMYGYVVAPSGNSDEGIDITDEEHLTQIASPNSTDRFSRYPTVSQGDWSKGERQRLYVEPSMYYQSDGNVDVSTPGNLTLFPGLRTDTLTTTGTYNRCPIQSDGGTWYAGIKTAGGNIYQSTGGGAPAAYTVAAGHELYDLLYTPFALVGITDQGLWVITGGGGSSSLVSESFANPELSVKAMAYLDDQIFYINNTSGGTSYIKTYTRSTNAVATVLTSTASEVFYQCICSTAGGIFFATTSKLPFQNFLYIWSGSTADTPERIGAIEGRVETCVESMGTVYLLVRNHQKSYSNAPAWTLYAVVGSQISVVDDARFLTDPNFAPTCSTVDTYDANVGGSADFTPMMWSDGRFLYIAWPGLGTRRVDLVSGGISQIGPNSSSGQANVHSRRFITGDVVPYTDITAYGSTAKVVQFSAAATTGSLTSSFLDFDSPGIGKVFRAVEFQLSKAPTGTQSVAWGYRLDQTSGFTGLTTRQISDRTFVAYFPTGTKGTEVQLKGTLTADASAGAPIVTSVSAVADVGRVFKMTLSCRRGQQQRSQDGACIPGPYTAKDLQANILNMRNLAGGRGYAYVADATQSSGVSQIQVRLVDYHRVTPNGASVGQRQVDGDLDLEGDMALQFSESFDP